MHRGLTYLAYLMIAVATIPHIIVVPMVGPANIIYSLVVTWAVLVLVAKTKAGMTRIFLGLTGALMQFITPVPFWLCVDAGYRLCPFTLPIALENSDYNIGDGFVFALFLLGYALMGSRSQSEVTDG